MLEAEELRHFLERRAPDLRLKDGPYETVAGLLVQDFITVWPIIREPAAFEELSRRTAAHLAVICERLNCSLIVGCSSTVMSIFEGVRGHLPTSIELLHLGTHPLERGSDEFSDEFTDRNVIIFTDVVSTGRLINDTRRLVEMAGGQVALSVSLFRIAYSSMPISVDGDNKLTFVDELDVVPLRGADSMVLYIAEQPVNVVERDVEARRPRTIDMETVFPVEPRQDVRYDAAFDPLEKLSKVESSKPVTSVGYFGNRDRVFSVFVDIQALVDSARDRIEEVLRHWASIARREGLEPVILSTPTAENRWLLASLEEFFLSSTIDARFAFFLKYDTFEGSFPFRILDDLADLQGKSVIILFATIHTSDTLRALCAQLSLLGCSSIHALTVVNRMTPASASFVARILHLGQAESSEGQEGEKLRPSTPSFEFKSLFRVWDLSVSDLRRGEAYVARRLRIAQEMLPSASDRTSAENIIKYFRPAQIQSNSGLVDLFVNERLDDQSRVVEQMILSALESLVRDRKISHLIDLLGRTNLTKRQQFTVLRYLMSDIARLSSERNLARLGQVLLPLIGLDVDQYASRFSEEAILRGIEVQARALTVCGIVAPLFLHSNSIECARIARAVDVALESILAAFAAAPFSSGSIARLANREWCFGFSFTYKQFCSPSDHDHVGFVDMLGVVQLDVDHAIRAQGSDASDRLRDVVKWLAMERLRNGGDAAVPEAMLRTEKRSVVSNLLQSITSFRQTFEDRSEDSLGFCLRSVRQFLCWPSPRHSELAKAFKIYAGTLDVEAAPSELVELGTGSVGRQRLQAVSELLIICARLSEMLAYLRRLFDSAGQANSERDWQQYYRESHSTSFQFRVAQLESRLQRVRDVHKMSGFDVRDIQKLTKLILADVYGSAILTEAKDSTLKGDIVNFIAGFETDFNAIFESVIEASSRRFYTYYEDEQPDRPISAVFDIKWGAGLDRKCSLIVLHRSDIVRRVIDNCIYNFRHGLDAKKRFNTGLALGEVSINVVEGTESFDAFDYLAIRFVNSYEPAGPGVRRGSTIDSFVDLFQQYDSFYTQDINNGKFTVELRMPLISRATEL